MTTQFDVAVIGGGIVGLAHAWMATRRGLRTVLLERSTVAQGASVRNFGMIWPIGQPAGELYSLALRSRNLWRELHTAGAISVEECGSVHLAHHAEELAVLEEFCSQGMHEARMMTAEETRKRTPLANPQGLLGGMWSPTELRVDPRVASSRLAGWLAAEHSVEFHFETPVTHIAENKVHAADGRQWSADRILICSGSDLKTLYPQTFAKSGLRLCKLQMLMAKNESPGPQPAAHIASGLTLRHYTAFQTCPSLAALKTRIAEESPELDRYGIHVMASQFPDGRVILGDSHEYGTDISPFDKTEIDDLMLRELQKVIRLSDWTIHERWHGIYAKHATRPVFESQPTEGVHVFVGTGGAGMTLAFGLADRAWTTWEKTV
ncbi:MAG: TIGR03364 family FAD-dependent oxidoreductase [Planctomycetaceae bacterium]|nr:TIGR03364 family FAD-dependent oxidoreductase [Planctomycetaceae bacterium]